MFIIGEPSRFQPHFVLSNLKGMAQYESEIEKYINGDVTIFSVNYAIDKRIRYSLVTAATQCL